MSAIQPILTNLTELSADASLIIDALSGPQWGIFDTSGSAVLVGDSCLEFEYSKDWRVSDYPIENGQFESYNKVNTPFEVRFVFTKGGSKAERSDFLINVDTVCDSITAYNAVTPLRTYPNVTLTRAGYAQKSDKGATLLIVEIKGQQIRQATSVTATNTASPSGAQPQSLGNVQLQDPGPLAAVPDPVIDIS